MTAPDMPNLAEALKASLKEARHRECGESHESADLTGIRCELTLGHHGDHLAWQPVSWPQDGA